MRRSLALFALFALACTGGGDDPVSSDTGSPSDPEAAPQILEFSATPTRVGPDASATFFALVTDPQGIEDVIGGSLKSDGQTLAAFATSADEGSYQVEVSFDDLAAAHGADSSGATGTLTLRGVFSDQSGNTSGADLDITLDCDAEQLCAEGCADIETDPAHCGGCGADCDSALDAAGLRPIPDVVGVDPATCEGGACAGMTECFVDADADDERTCDELCQDLGGTCFDTVLYESTTACEGEVTLQDDCDRAFKHHFEHWAGGCLCRL